MRPIPLTAAGILGGLILFAALWRLPIPVIAQVAPPTPGALQLGLPLACTMNQDCWVVNYVDIDPGPEVLDAGCGHRTYQEHNGTDFGLRNLAAMRQGVPVLAAAPGTVVATRDGMADISIAITGTAAVKGKECGNGVLLKHPNGWSTQYCHMRQDSVKVQQGQSIHAGQSLGLVGLSGETEFPHVHLTVRQGDLVIDPFLGRSQKGQCVTTPRPHPLWAPALREQMAYQPLLITQAGASDQPLRVQDVRNGDLPPVTFTPDSPALVLWSDLLGIEPGDTLRISLTGPDGKEILQQTRTLTRRQAAWFQYVGKKRTVPWAKGLYEGVVQLSRPDATREKRIAFTVY